MHENSLKNIDSLPHPEHLIQASMKISSRLRCLQLFLNLILKLAVFIILICVLVPFSPKMPAPGLDASWALGLNQAVALGLSFGKEIIFTLGPYSSIYTKAYHPKTNLMMMVGSLYLACSYWMSIVFLMRGIKWHWTVFLGLCFLTMIYSRDSLFFSYPLLTGLISYKIKLLSKRAEEIAASTKQFASPVEFQKKSTGVIKQLKSNLTLTLIFLFAPFGLLPLIKGSLLILCLIVLLFCTLLLLWNKHRKLAFVCFISPIISMILFWVGAGQSVVYLPHYLITTLSLASNFTEAMSFSGNTNEVLIYLLASSLLLLVITWQKQLSYSDKLFLLGIFFVFLFLSFKTGFTRHYGHAFISSTSILIAALLLPYLFNSRLIIPALLFCLYTSNYIGAHYTKVSISNNVISTYTTAWHGLKNRVMDKNWLNQNFSLSMHFMKEQAAFPILQGKTDIYSYDQSYLIASGILWDPRPVFQSYSVFTPWLARKNKEHLQSNHRPDNVIFKVEPIDGRLPSLEDGMSWPILLKNYQPTEIKNDFLFLKKNNTPISSSASWQLVQKEQYILGDVIKVPDINSPLFTQIHLEPTFYGLLALTFFKASPLFITVELKNGTKKQFRIPANMTKSEFLLSPLIENTKEFAQLYEDPSLLGNKQVLSLSIRSEPSKSLHWQKKYTIVFEKMEE